VTLPKSVIAALQDETGTLTSIPLDDFLAARREDPDLPYRLRAIHLLELLLEAADRLDTLQLPIIPIPTDVRVREQCTQAVVTEGGAVSRCLRLEHDQDAPHSNGNLRWTEDEQGRISAWFETQPFEEIGLGELLRSGVHLTIPHLPADEAARLTGQNPPQLEDK
jgi:hypothetical protein